MEAQANLRSPHCFQSFHSRVLVYLKVRRQLQQDESEDKTNPERIPVHQMWILPYEYTVPRLQQKLGLHGQRRLKHLK